MKIEAILRDVTVSINAFQIFSVIIHQITYRHSYQVSSTPQEDTRALERSDSLQACPLLLYATSPRNLFLSRVTAQSLLLSPLYLLPSLELFPTSR
jgi:hypothetical protein